MDQFNVSLQVHQLEEVFDSSTSSLDRSSTNLLLHATSSDHTPKAKLQALLQPLSPSSQTSLIAHLRLILLTRLARQQALKLILTAETSTDLAVKTLSGIAQGRGWALGEEVAPVHRIDEGEIYCASCLTQTELGNRFGSPQTCCGVDGKRDRALQPEQGCEGRAPHRAKSRARKSVDQSRY